MSDLERTETEDSTSVASGFRGGGGLEGRARPRRRESGVQDEEDEEEDFGEEDEEYDEFEEDAIDRGGEIDLARLQEEELGGVGGDGSDDELGIEREQEDLLEGFREDVLAGGHSHSKEDSQRNVLLQADEGEHRLEKEDVFLDDSTNR